ncbi:MAG: J domain-containing protein [Pseudoxanthomonas sp.]
MNRWYGKLLGALAGMLLFRFNPLFGALIGLLLGHWFDRGGGGRRDDPYKLFGLTRQASDAEVEQAWRRLISQCHPDRLARAAPELRARAEARARELNAAYDRIRAQRGQR